MRSPDADVRHPIRNLLKRLIRASAVWSLLPPMGLIVVSFIAWGRWGVDHVSPPLDGISLEKINVSPAPPHVRSDVAAAVYHDTAMDSLSLLDKSATAKIASAFSMHPWVRDVRSVRKRPGGQVDVLLTYRRPVAMVRTRKPNSSDLKAHYFPIDGDAVLLPSQEFTQSETLDYIHINVPGTYSINRVGTPFGDPRVTAAARLAEILSQMDGRGGIRSIGVHGDPRQVRVPQLEVTTATGARHFWGSPPGQEYPGEPSAEMKLQTLRGLSPGEAVDLRIARQPSSAAR